MLLLRVSYWLAFGIHKKKYFLEILINFRMKKLNFSQKNISVLY